MSVYEAVKYCLRSATSWKNVHVIFISEMKAFRVYTHYKKKIYKYNKQRHECNKTVNLLLGGILSLKYVSRLSRVSIYSF